MAKSCESIDGWASRWTRCRVFFCLLTTLSGAACARSARAQDPSVTTAVADATEGHRNAQAALKSADAAYRAALLTSLSSENPYERKLALERFAGVRYLIDEGVRAALVPILEESAPLHSERCAAMIARLSRAYGGQGEELEYAQCNVNGGISNGKLAAQFLATQVPFATIAARVRQKPEVVEAIILAVGGYLRFGAKAALTELKQATNDEARAGLLRLLVMSDCQSSANDELVTLAPLLESSNAKTSRRAAIAVLRLTQCLTEDALNRQAALRTRATRLLGARFREFADKDVVVEAAWLGEAADVFVPLLSYRYDQSPAERVAVIRALGATGYRAVATPKLVSILEDPKVAFLHDDVLRAMKSKGPAASTATASVLRWLARAEFDHADGLETLSAMGEKLERYKVAPLMAGYKKRCSHAGSVFMFNLRRDAGCARQRTALEAICERSGIWFRDQSGTEE